MDIRQRPYGRIYELTETEWNECLRVNRELVEVQNRLRRLRRVMIGSIAILGIAIVTSVLVNILQFVR